MSVPWLPAEDRPLNRATLGLAAANTSKFVIIFLFLLVSGLGLSAKMFPGIEEHSTVDIASLNSNFQVCTGPIGLQTSKTDVSASPLDSPYNIRMQVCSCLSHCLYNSIAVRS